MGSVSHQQQPDTQTTQAPITDTPTTSGMDNSLAQQRLAGGSAGGQAHTITRGETLWSISEQTYGHGRYWRQIMQANPGQVFRGGDLIIVGDTLTLPSIDIEQESPTPAVELADGGVCEATEPRQICTEYGNFSIYPDDYIGELTSEEGIEAVTESQYTAIIAERQAAADAQREQTEAEVEALLSYGAFDWAITDAEALEAYNKLVALPMSQLQAAVGNISNISRLLEQLPDSTRADANFSKLLVALGPTRIGPYLNDLLSYGLFDWAVTDAEAQAVIAILGMLSQSARGTLLTRLGTALQTRLLENLPGRGSALSAADKQVVRDIFFAAADDNMALKELAFEVRFNIDVHGSDGHTWDAATLTRCWEVVEVLPAAHVEANPELTQWIRYGDSGNGGWYDDRERVSGSDNPDYRGAGFNIDTGKIDNKNTAAEAARDLDGDGTNETAADPLYDVVRFNKVIRHEVGHAVDAQIGASQSYCIGNAAGGNWTEYGTNIATIVSEMVASSGAGIAALASAQKQEVIDELVAAARGDDTSTLTADIQALSFFSSLDAAVQAQVLADAVLPALTQAIDDPWYDHLPNGGTPLGGRIYQRSYGSSWTSYDLAARARKVSTYQFRAPGEWFAEAYATYYEPGANGEADGSLLASVDPATKRWFDTNVAGLTPPTSTGGST